jgi:hypothetical protein
MRPRIDPPATLLRWLDAERTGQAEDAEAALLELVTLLPPLAPSAGFADRVLREISSLPAAAPAAARPSLLPRLFRSRGFRLVLASCLLATGISLVWLPQTLAALAGIFTFGDVVQLGVASAVDLGHWLAIAGRIGEWFVTVIEAIAVSLLSPAALKITAACLAISGTAFVVLRELMTRNRSWSYVDSAQ